MMFPKPQRRTTPEDWERLKVILAIKFFKAGIVKCELNLEDCTRDNYCYFAHRLKRADIKTLDELEFCILACNNCHQKIEYEPDMYEIVTYIHDNRKVQP